jgi:hypothetical protein
MISREVFEFISSELNGNGTVLFRDIIGKLQFGWQLQVLLSRGYKLDTNEVICIIERGVTVHYSVLEELFSYLGNEGVELRAEDLLECLNNENPRKLLLYLRLKYDNLKNNESFIISAGNDVCKSILLKAGFLAPPRIQILDYSVRANDGELIRREIEIAVANKFTIYPINAACVRMIIDNLALDLIELILQCRNISWYNSSIVHLSVQYKYTAPEVAKLLEKYGL